MRTEDLKNFIAIYELGSLNKAASRLNISQQGLSRSIRSLEENIGARLFVRSSKGVELTSYGKEFIKYAAKLVEDLEQLEEYIETNRESRKDNIKVGLRVSINSSPMSSAINNTVEDFGQLNKDINIVIHSASQDMLLEELESGELDIVQVIGPVDEKKYDVYPIFKYKLYVLVSKALRAFDNEYVGIEDIQDLPLVLPTKHNPLCEQILSIFDERKLDPSAIIYEASAKTLAHLVHRKNGVAFMPENSASTVCFMYPDVQMYKLVPETEFCYSVVLNKGGFKNPKIKGLIAYLQENTEKNLIPDSI